MRIEYHLTITVGDQLRAFAKRYGSLERLRKRVAAGKPTLDQVANLEEWERYIERGAAPDESIEVMHALLFHDERSFFRLVTAERLRILHELRSGRSYESVNELARALGRDPKNVRSDLRELERHGLVRLTKRNARRCVPQGRVGSMVIRM